MIASKDTPLKNAHDVDAARISWALIDSEVGTAVSARIAAISHREIVSRDAGRCGGVVVINNWEWFARRGFVRLIYHLRARTGHQSLSSPTNENDLMSGTKMSGGVNDPDWFFARKPMRGIRRTPDGSHRMWPDSMDKVCSSLRRRDC